MESVEKKVMEAIVGIVGELRRTSVVLEANLRDDLDFDCMSFLLLSFDLGIDVEDLSKAKTVQDVVVLCKQ
ncbi:MAG: hypothetical protein IKA03_01265 [Alphaproteobacteria bacterium]|nr:hypothetical protein [Alphaproteobacteria bacterium]